MKIVSATNKDKNLWQNYLNKKADNKMLFPTEGSKLLGVSELELLLASPYSQYLGKNCKDVLLQIEQLGEVESIVRNELAVHEKRGVFQNLKLGDKMGIALNVGGMDLRFFMNQWSHVLAFKDDSKANVETEANFSLQFFDSKGNAIDKVFLRDLNSQNIQKWQAIVDTQKATVTSDEITLEDIDNNAKTEWQYKELDASGKEDLHEQWHSMVDIHQFHFILRKLAIDRASSYQQAPEGMTSKLSNEAIETLLNAARESKTPIMTFVGNTGLVQIQTGPVHNIKRMGKWINILDKAEEKFTLHLNDGALAQVWCVRRPTKDGIVTCIEGFDQYGDTVVSFFGLRQEGEPEREDWRAITAKVEKDHGQNLL